MPRITTFKKPKLNRSRYHEHQQGGLFEEDLNNFSTSAVAIQINPKHVDLIMEEVIKKYGWKDKLELLEDKWKEECQRQGISKASVGVAFEILRDIVHQGWLIRIYNYELVEYTYILTMIFYHWMMNIFISIYDSNQSFYA